MGRIVTAENLRKVGALLRDHRPRQVVNTLRFAVHAARGFPTLRAPFDPPWLVLFITARCNLRCLQCSLHCPEVGGRATPWPDMPDQLFRRILDRYPGSINLTLGGGEPLLHPRWSEMARLASSRHLKVHIPTNGTLLAGRADEVLATPVEMLNISLYGTTGSEFARLTGGRAVLFERCLDAIADLMARRRPGAYPRIVRLSFVCTADNLDAVPALVRLGEELAVDQVKLRNIHPSRATRYGTDACLFEGEEAALRLQQQLEAARPGLPVVLPRLYPRGEGARACSQPWRVLTVDGSGAVAPCCVRRSHRRYGHLEDGPEVWNGPVFRAARRRLLDGGRALPVGCRHCEENVAGRPWVGGPR